MNPSRKGECYFHGKLILSHHSIAIRTSDLFLGFPMSATDVASRLVQDARIDTDEAKELFVSAPGTDHPFPIGINLNGILSIWSGSARTHLGSLADDSEENRHEMRLLWEELAQKLSVVSKIFDAYRKLEGKWNNEAAINRFLATMGDILSGEPRHRQVSKCFYETTIRRKTFRLILDQAGPYVVCGRGGVQLDRGEVIHLEVDYVGAGKVRPAGYYIAKYGNAFEADISLDGFGKRDFKLLSKELGARSLLEGSNRFDFADFEKSNAFQGLMSWMIQHPRYAREFKGKHLWYDAALDRLKAQQTPR